MQHLVMECTPYQYIAIKRLIRYSYEIGQAVLRSQSRFEDHNL